MKLFKRQIKNMKTVLITGASSGIGKETAYKYAENNYNLVLVARRINRLEMIQKEIESKYSVSVELVNLDLSKIDSADVLYNKVKSKGIDVDVLINNAGFGINDSFLDSDIDKETDMILLNVVTLTRLTKLFVRDMVQKGEGHIINIASTAAFQPIPKFAVYGATKSYVLNFSEALAFELKGKNVSVTAICPGATQSEFAKVSKANEKVFKNKPDSKDLAEFVYQSMKSGKVVAIHGLSNKLMVFSQRFAPRSMVTAIAAKIME